MKILVLNPHIDAMQEVLRSLRDQGHVAFIASSVEEAWQILCFHGASIDLALIHREAAKGAGEPGLELLAKIKSTSDQADLPIILTSSQWNDAEFARHQQGPQGVNAYLHSPFEGATLLAILGGIFEADPNSGLIPTAHAKPPTEPPQAPKPPGLQLEDPSHFFAKNEESSKTGLEIRLEAPSVGPDSPPASYVPAPGMETDPGHQDGPQVIELAGGSDPAPIEIQVAAPEEPALTSAPEPELAPAPPPPTRAEEPSVQVYKDRELAQEMPYLYSTDPFPQPVDDAIVPGGAAQSPDVETLKKYLLLREQDVAVLSTQLKSAKERISSVEDQVRAEKARNVELTHMNLELKRKLEDYDKQKAAEMDGLQAEINELKFQGKAKADKVRLLENQVRETTDEIERLKERVRSDIRKIRVREKELENKLEIMKKDAEALIAARENKIVELKRKIDLLEFNMDLLQDQYAREKDHSNRLRERLSKAGQVVRVVGGLLDSTQSESMPADSDSDSQAEISREVS